MNELKLYIKKCKNGYYIRIFDGTWYLIYKSFIAKDTTELMAIIGNFVIEHDKREAN